MHRKHAVDLCSVAAEMGENSADKRRIVENDDFIIDGVALKSVGPESKALSAKLD